MSKIPVAAQSLNALGDGYAGKAIDRCLDLINKDLIDRGHDGKPRKLVVTYTFTPEPSGRLKIRVTTKTTVPDLAPPETIAKLDRQAGGFVFNPDASENPDQMTTNDVEVE